MRTRIFVILLVTLFPVASMMLYGNLRSYQEQYCELNRRGEDQTLRYLLGYLQGYAQDAQRRTPFSPREILDHLQTVNPHVRDLRWLSREEYSQSEEMAEQEGQSDTEEFSDLEKAWGYTNPEGERVVFLPVPFPPESSVAESAGTGGKGVQPAAVRMVFEPPLSHPGYRELMSLHAVMAGVFLAVLVLLSLVISRLITRPIGKIVENLRQMEGRQESDAPSESLRRDEVGDLQKGVTHLVESFRQGSVDRGYLHGIINSLLEAVLFVDYEEGGPGFRRITMANPVAEELLGYPAGGLKGLSLEQVLAEDRRGQGDLMSLLEDKGQVKSAEAVYLDKEGRRIPVVFSGIVLEDGLRKGRELVCAAKDISEKRNREAELRFYTTNDELTGAMNRRTGLYVLENMINHSMETGEPVTLGFVDVCGTSAVNSDKGLEAGDAHIRRAAEVLQASVRDMDTVARLEADKFILILPGNLADTSSAVSRRILSELPGGVSYGFTEIAGTGLAVEDILQMARRKMELNKKASRRG